MPLPSGTHLGSYVVLTSLGSGGMGEVYKARDPRLNRLVAIKVLPASLQTDPKALARFEREARVLAGLAHPHIVAMQNWVTPPTDYAYDPASGRMAPSCLCPS